MQVYNPATGQMEEMPDYGEPSPRGGLPTMDPRMQSMFESQPDAMGPMAPQEQLPNDYWSRVAMATGGRPFGPQRFGQHQSGLQLLAALIGGYANARSGIAAGKYKEVQERNASAREAASTLAKHRHEMLRDEAKSAAELRNAVALKRTPGATSPTEPLAMIMNPTTGIPEFVPRSQAVGQQPYIRPQQEPAPIAVFNPDGTVRYVARGQAIGKLAPASMSSDTEKLSSAFYTRAKNAVGNAMRDGLEDRIRRQSLLGVAQTAQPWNMLKTPDQQAYKQSMDEFINALLRRESGAAISVGEYKKYGAQYFWVPGDQDKVIEQKRRSREAALEGLKTESGRAIPQGVPGATESTKSGVTKRWKRVNGRLVPE